MENTGKMTAFLPANIGEYARKTYKIAIFGVKNNFVLAGILLIGYCVIAPAVYIAGTTDAKVSADTFWEIMRIYSVIAAYVGGLLIPAVMFAYVHKRRDRDFYHSMPVKRGQYFIGYFCSGFAMFTVPYLLMCVVMGLLGGYLGAAFAFVLHTLVLYIIIYSAVTFSIMFSGSNLSTAVTLAFLNTFPVTVTFCSLLLRVNIDSGVYMRMLEPYIYIFTPLSGGYSFFQVFDEGPFYWVLWVQLGIAVIELVLAFIMYNLRRGETTMAVAFPKTRYILQYGVMFLVALFCTSVFSSIFIYIGDMDEARFRISSEAVIWTAIMTFVAFVILNMILEQNFRAAFHRVRYLFIFAGAYVVVVAVLIGLVGGLPYWVVPIKTDAVLIRQQRYVVTYDKPDNYGDEWYYKEGEYAGGYVANYFMDENGRSLYHIDMGEDYYIVTDPQQVAELTKRISDYENGSDNTHGYIDYYKEGEYYYASFTLYTLKPGKKIEKGTYIDDLSSISSQWYGVYLGDITDSEMEHFKDGMDLMKIDYRSYSHGHYYGDMEIPDTTETEFADVIIN